jgi:hypothetical protein
MGASLPNNQSALPRYFPVLLARKNQASGMYPKQILLILRYAELFHLVSQSQGEVIAVSWKQDDSGPL